MLMHGELAFYTLAGNGLSGLIPAADVQATPYAFRNSEQVLQATGDDLARFTDVSAVFQEVRRGHDWHEHQYAARRPTV